MLYYWWQFTKFTFISALSANELLTRIALLAIFYNGCLINKYLRFHSALVVSDKNKFKVASDSVASAQQISYEIRPQFSKEERNHTLI